MRLLHQVLAASYPALSAFRKFENLIGYNKSARLRVLLYHDFAPEEHIIFESQLAWLSRNWSFISPEQFVSIINGEETIQKNSLLLTFDDGFSSNRRIAEKILNPRGIQALFFVVSELVAIEDPEEARQFIARQIQPGASKEKLPNYVGNMKWADLEALLEQGHTIGAHSRTHARLSEIKSSSSLIDEIVSSADRLGSRLGVDIEHFAYPFGDLDSFSIQAIKLAQRRFRYVYSGLRGNNDNETPAFAIRRDALKPTDANALMGAFLEGGADFLYTDSLKHLEGWAEEIAKC